MRPARICQERLKQLVFWKKYGQIRFNFCFSTLALRHLLLSDHYLFDTFNGGEGDPNFVKSCLRSLHSLNMDYAILYLQGFYSNLKIMLENCCSIATDELVTNRGMSGRSGQKQNSYNQPNEKKGDF